MVNLTRSEKMSFKFSFKSTEMFRLSQFERKGVPNGWRRDAKRALRCHRLSSWYLKGRIVCMVIPHFLPRFFFEAMWGNNTISSSPMLCIK